MNNSVIRSALGPQTLRSMLISLLPMGMGTILVEGLSSYLARLAKAHSLYLGVLLSKYIIPLFDNELLSRSIERGNGRIYARPGNFIGFNGFSQKLVSILEYLTMRDDLKFLTLLPFRSIFDQKGLLKRIRSWCPLCLEDWEKSNHEIYEPIVWAFSMIHTCPVHNCRLVSICPTCRKPQEILTRKMLPGYCGRCGSWLASSTPAEPILPSAEYDRWIMRNIGQLLAHEPNFSYMPDKSFILEGINRHIADHFGGNATSFAVAYGIPKATSIRWKASISFPTLQHLLRLSYLSNTPLLDFLSSGVLNMRYVRHTISPQNAKKSSGVSIRKNFDAISVKLLLDSILKDQISKNWTVTRVAAHLGFTKRTLYSHFPTECKKIADKAAKQKESTRNANAQQLKLFVENVTSQLHLFDIYPSYDRVEACSPKKGILRGKEGRKTWRRKMKQLGLWS